MERREGEEEEEGGREGGGIGERGITCIGRVINLKVDCYSLVNPCWRFQDRDNETVSVSLV